MRVALVMAMVIVFVGCERNAPAPAREVPPAKTASTPSPSPDPVLDGIEKGEPVSRTVRARLFMLNQATDIKRPCDKELSEFIAATHRSSSIYESFKIHEDWDTHRRPIALDPASGARLREFADQLTKAAAPLRTGRAERQTVLAAIEKVVATARAVAAVEPKRELVDQAPAIEFARAVDYFNIVVPAACR